MRFTKSAFLILFGLIIVAGWALAAHQDAARADAALDFELTMTHHGDRMVVVPAAGPLHEMSFTLSDRFPGPVYLSADGVDTELDRPGASPWCFTVEWVDGRTRMTSLRGTNWKTLEYSCGTDAATCSFVVTRSGVKGL